MYYLIKSLVFPSEFPSKAPNALAKKLSTLRVVIEDDIITASSSASISSISIRLLLVLGFDL
jgi:hypothetical protein